VRYLPDEAHQVIARQSAKDAAAALLQPAAAAMGITLTIAILMAIVSAILNAWQLHKFNELSEYLCVRLCLLDCLCLFRYLSLSIAILVEIVSALLKALHLHKFKTLTKFVLPVALVLSLIIGFNFTYITLVHPFLFPFHCSVEWNRCNVD
jgi:hypothetical protein